MNPNEKKHENRTGDGVVSSFGWNEGYCVGMDHSWNPQQEHAVATQATSITFAGSPSCGVEYNYYSQPWSILYW